MHQYAAFGSLIISTIILGLYYAIKTNESEYCKIAQSVILGTIVINCFSLFLVGYYRKLKFNPHPGNLFVNSFLTLVVYIGIRLCFNNNDLSRLLFENRNSFDNIESIGHAAQGFLSFFVFLFADYHLIVSFVSKVVLIVYPVYNLIKRMTKDFDKFYDSSYNNNLFEWITGFYLGIVVGFLVKAVVEIKLKHDYSVNRPMFVSRIFAFLSFIPMMVAVVSSIVSGIQTDSTTERWLLFIVPNCVVICTFCRLIYNFTLNKSSKNITKDLMTDNVTAFENPLFGSCSENSKNTNNLESGFGVYEDVRTDSAIN